VVVLTGAVAATGMPRAPRLTLLPAREDGEGGPLRRPLPVGAVVGAVDGAVAAALSSGTDKVSVGGTYKPAAACVSEVERKEGEARTVVAAVADEEGKEGRAGAKVARGVVGPDVVVEEPVETEAGRMGDGNTRKGALATGGGRARGAAVLVKLDGLTVVGTHVGMVAAVVAVVVAVEVVVEGGRTDDEVGGTRKPSAAAPWGP
jgi:hypothetical protein